MLYERVVSKGGKVSYKEQKIVGPDVSEFTNKELITCGVSLGMTMLMILERTLPEHSRNARKMKAVEDAIFDLAKGMGEPITEEMTQYWVDVWNHCMNQIQQGLLTIGEKQ